MRLIEPIAVTDTGSFSRPDPGTYYDRTGQLKSAAPDVPRFSFNPLSLAFEGLLIENEATNLLLRSEEFDVYWTKVQTTVNVNAAVAPDGTTTMDGLVATAVNGAHYLDFNLTTGITAGMVTGESIYIKKGVSSRVQLQCYGVGNWHHAVILDMTTGAVSFSADSNGGQTTLSYGAQQISVDVWRLYVLGYPDNSGTNRRFRLGYSDAAGNFTFTGDAVSNYVYAWGAQLEAGGVTSYIKTAGATVARAADVMGGMMVTNIPEDDADEWVIGETYAKGNAAMVTTAAYHYVYKSKVDSNIGNDPTLELDPIKAPVNWQLVGKTNRWKPFDNYLSSQAVYADEIFYSIVVPETSFIDSNGLANLDATLAEVVVTEPNGNVAYTRTAELIVEVTDYWEWWFSPVERAQYLPLTGLPVYAGVRIDIRLSNIGADVKVGAIVPGLSSDAGETELGLSLSNTDYSVKTVDEFGNIILTPRPYSDSMSLTTIVKNTDLPRIRKLLTRIRATPTFAIGAEDVYDEATSVYGWPERWETVTAYHDETVLSITWKGLT